MKRKKSTRAPRFVDVLSIDSGHLPSTMHEMAVVENLRQEAKRSKNLGTGRWYRFADGETWQIMVKRVS